MCSVCVCVCDVIMRPNAIRPTTRSEMSWAAISGTKVVSPLHASTAAVRVLLPPYLATTKELSTCACACLCVCVERERERERDRVETNALKARKEAKECVRKGTAPEILCSRRKMPTICTTWMWCSNETVLPFQRLRRTC